MPPFWGDPIFVYCERGHDPGFWAEPVNALSNLAFLAAAGAAAWQAARRPAPVSAAIPLLILLTALIGAGSFLFHTLATRAAALADVVPIAAFMLVYLAFALRSFAGWPWPATFLAAVLFAFALQGPGPEACRSGIATVLETVRLPCDTGTLHYAPALAALFAVAAGLALQRHPAAGYIGGAGVLFAVSMAMRAMDGEACGALRLFGRAQGTHVYWHVLNALTLYILLLAGIRHGQLAVPRGRGGMVDTQDLKS